MVISSCSQADFARSLLDPDRPVPLELQSPEASEISARFSVYRNNVVSSLIDALAETFEVVEQLVGREFFRAMAGIYVRASPPVSPVLASYGQSFPDFVSAFPPASGLPYLADVARIEYARVSAFNAADEAHLSSLDGSIIAAGEDALAELKFGFHPSAAVVISDYAAVTLWAVHQSVEGFERVEVDQPEAALISRRDDEVEVVPVSRETARFIECLLAGTALRPAVQVAIAESGALDLSASVSLLLKQQAIVTAIPGSI